MKKEGRERLPDFSEIQKHIFEKRKDRSIWIGGEKIKPEIRDLLRDQARNIGTSQLWEILNASIVNEAVNLALLQSANYDHVQYGKALWHYCNFINTVVGLLAEE